MGFLSTLIITKLTFSIETRLRALGYNEEDFDTRYDEKHWQWKQLLNQIRPVMEQGLLLAISRLKF